MALHPTSVNNTFGRHFILWSLFLPLMLLIFIPFVWPDQKIDTKEVEMVSSFRVNVDDLTESVNKRFNGLFIESGVMAKSQAFFGDGSNEGVQGMAAKWIHGVWMMIYKAMWRMYVLGTIFFLPLLALAIPAAVDGFAVRARKKYRFENSNPVFFYSSMHLVVLMMGLFAFLPLAPISLTATMLFGLLLALAGGIWFAATNFQTGS